MIQMEIHNKNLYNADLKNTLCRREKLPNCVGEISYLCYYWYTECLLNMQIIIRKNRQTCYIAAVSVHNIH